MPMVDAQAGEEDMQSSNGSVVDFCDMAWFWSLANTACKDRRKSALLTQQRCKLQDARHTPIYPTADTRPVIIAATLCDLFLHLLDSRSPSRMVSSRGVQAVDLSHGKLTVDKIDATEFNGANKHGDCPDTAKRREMKKVNNLTSQSTMI